MRYYVTLRNIFRATSNCAIQKWRYLKVCRYIHFSFLPLFSHASNLIRQSVIGEIYSCFEWLVFEQVKKKKGFQIGVATRFGYFAGEYYSRQRGIRDAISPTTSSLSLPFFFIGHCCPSPDILAIFRKVSNTERERKRERLGVDYRLVSRSGIKTFLPNV